VAFYEKVEWPTGGVLMGMPFDPALHGSSSKAREGRCTWADHDVLATWSVVWKGERWTTCEEHLPAFARYELKADVERLG